MNTHLAEEEVAKGLTQIDAPNEQRVPRAELIRLGWITKDTGSFQRKLNRDGAYFAINTAWRRAVKRCAPHGAQNRAESAPPKEGKETPFGFKTRKRPPSRYDILKKKRSTQQRERLELVFARQTGEGSWKHQP